MKELKFRIWIKDEKRYYDESDEESYMIVPNGNVTYTSEAYEEDDVWFNDTTSATNDVIVEQYTGIKDKNGKEIYEGDIVEYDWYITSDNQTYRTKEQVIFDDMGARLDTDRIRFCTNVEVIGNIHESNMEEE